MPWIVRDFECPDCDHVFEELYKEGDDIICPNCGGENAQPLLSAPRIDTFSIMDPYQKRESLMKRSRDHSEKNKKNTVERIKETGK